MAVNPIDSYFAGVGNLEYICTVQKADHPMGLQAQLGIGLFLGLMGVRDGGP